MLIVLEVLRLSSCSIVMFDGRCCLVLLDEMDLKGGLMRQFLLLKSLLCSRSAIIIIALSWLSRRRIVLSNIRSIWWSVVV
jgi:hypothetical protein